MDRETILKGKMASEILCMLGNCTVGDEQASRWVGRYTQIGRSTCTVIYNIMDPP